MSIPVCRVSPFTDLRNVKGGIKSDPEHYKSEGNISSIELGPSLNGSQWPEFLCSNHTGQEHTMEAVVVQNSTDQIAANINIYY